MPCKGTPKSQCHAPHCVSVRQTSKRKGYCRSYPKRKSSKKTTKSPVKKYKIVKSGKSSPKKKSTKTPVKKYKMVKSGKSSPKKKPSPKKSQTTSPKKKPAPKKSSTKKASPKKAGPKQKKSAKIPKGNQCSLYELANKHDMLGYYDTMMRKGKTPAQYRKAYLNLSRIVHPDKLTNSSCHGNHLAFKQLGELQLKRMND